MQSLLLLGRQPALGVAELESLYGSSAVSLVGKDAALVDVDPCLLAFDRLGGSIKFCKVLTRLPTTNWRDIETYLLKAAPEHSEQMPEGKLYLGLSVHGLQVNIRQMEATGLNIKKAIRATGRPVRLIPNKELQLSSAQVFHNKLDSDNGWELVLVRDGDATIIAQTVRIQDLDSYTIRDRVRPKRDSRVCMLPPKLAQIIINLATGPVAEDKLAAICDSAAHSAPPRLEQTILDPFCGTGVLLQEAELMGYDSYGTDLEQRMIDYSAANLEWLRTKYKVSAADGRLEKGDATNHAWTAPVTFVACETYLGKPFTSTPQPEILSQTVSDCNLIIKKFLQNLYPQLAAGTRLCIAVPAWQTRANQFRFLPLIDQIEQMGYNRMSFEHVRDDELLYYRADQIVARQLIVITKK